MHDVSLMEQAFAAFDAANAADPRLVRDGEREVPKELLYSRRMSARLAVFAPEAPEVVQLAARCQHICRWKHPREEYPMHREGYHAWREGLATFHADVAATILTEVGYEAETINRVRSLLRKENLKGDLEVQCLEDVICLVFLEHYFDDFTAKHEEEKIIAILRNTWFKMSEAGHAAALELPLSDETKRLVAMAQD